MNILYIADILSLTMNFDDFHESNMLKTKYFFIMTIIGKKKKKKDRKIKL
jgi:hypothetical protein